MIMEALRELGFRKFLRYIFFLWWDIGFSLMFFPPLRTTWLSVFGAKLGKNVILQKIRIINPHHHGLGNLSIGDNSVLSDNVSLDLADKIILGKHTAVGEGVIFSTHLKIGYSNHPLQKYFPPKKSPIIIGDGCFIGAGAIILSGVRIGEGVMVPAGTVVNRSLDSWVVVHDEQIRHLIAIKSKLNYEHQNRN